MTPPNRAFSAEEIQHILRTLASCNGNYEKAARKLVLTDRVVQQVDMVHNGTWNYTPEGRGPKPLQRYIIATRNIFDGIDWDRNPNNHKIKEARRLYNEGKIEMATGRDGFNILLYAIPRREIVTDRKPYFDTVDTVNNVIHLENVNA